MTSGHADAYANTNTATCVHKPIMHATTQLVLNNLLQFILQQVTQNAASGLLANIREKPVILCRYSGFNFG